MLSPRHANSFGSQTDILNYDRQSQMSYTQKINGVNKGAPMVINPNQINFAVVAPMSKDKRMTMLPEQIKQVVIERNRDRGLKREHDKKADPKNVKLAGAA